MVRFDTMELVPGSVFAGRYRLERVLGQGAMGTVWQATHTMTERHVAIKVLAEEHRTAEARARVLREAKACGRIQHKNVIEVLDVGELPNGCAYLVMPMLTGTTLEDRIDEGGPIPEAQAIDIALGIARALVAAHELGIVHRDLKPGNVFLHVEPGSGEPTVKVLDFGISKILSRDEASYTDAGRAVGSPAYMSPEQARGAADIDARTDVWSLGVLLCEMLTGSLPFPGDTPYAIVGHILHGAPPDFDVIAPYVSAPIRDLLRRTVQRDVAQRLPSARDVVAWLEAARTPGAIPAHAGRASLAWLPPAPTSSPFGAPPPSGPMPAPVAFGPPPSQRFGAPPQSVPQPFIPPAPPSSPQRPPHAITATSSVLVTQHGAHGAPSNRGVVGVIAGALAGVAVIAIIVIVVVSSGGRAPQAASSANAAAPPRPATPPAPTSSPTAAPSPEASASASAPAASAVAPAASAPAGSVPGAVPTWRPKPRPFPTGKRVSLPDSPG